LPIFYLPTGDGTKSPEDQGRGRRRKRRRINNRRNRRKKTRWRKWWMVTKMDSHRNCGGRAVWVR
jgi:hypothetical protein